MSFDSQEKSVSGSRPVELWKISTTDATYYRTTAPEDVVFALDGETYVAFSGYRDELAGASIVDPPEMQLAFPLEDDFVQENAFSTSPETIDVVGWRMHVDGAYVVWFSGEVVGGFSISGDWAKVRVPSLLADKLDSQIPNAYVQKHCNHVLYDDHCAVDRTLFFVGGTVHSISGRTVVVDVAASPVDGWASSGEVVRPSDGQRRLVYHSEKTSSTRITLTIEYAFRSLAVGNTVYVYAGCDHLIDGAAGCRPKFNNAVRFGGFPSMSPVNPFRGDIRGYPWKKV